MSHRLGIETAHHQGFYHVFHRHIVGRGPRRANVEEHPPINHGNHLKQRLIDHLRPKDVGGLQGHPVEGSSSGGFGHPAVGVVLGDLVEPLGIVWPGFIHAPLTHRAIHPDAAQLHPTGDASPCGFDELLHAMDIGGLHAGFPAQLGGQVKE